MEGCELLGLQGRGVGKSKEIRIKMGGWGRFLGMLMGIRDKN